MNMLCDRLIRLNVRHCYPWVQKQVEIYIGVAATYEEDSTSRQQNDISVSQTDFRWGQATQDWNCDALPSSVSPEHSATTACTQSSITDTMQQPDGWSSRLHNSLLSVSCLLRVISDDHPRLQLSARTIFSRCYPGVTNTCRLTKAESVRTYRKGWLVFVLHYHQVAQSMHSWGSQCAWTDGYVL